MSTDLEQLNSLVARIEVRSQWLPTLALNDPFSNSATPPGAASWFLKQLKPELIITPRNAAIGPITSAPYGTPGQTYWPQVKTALTIVGGAIVVRELWKRFGWML